MTEEELLEKAAIVTDYEGPLYCDNECEYYPDMETLLDVARQSDWDELPVFAFCGHIEPAVHLDTERIIECFIQDESYEDVYDDLKGIEELQVAIQRFNEMNKDVMHWAPDYSRKVAIPPQEAE